VRLDYLFVPESLLPAVTACDVFEHPELRDASDHLPIVGELALLADAAPRAEPTPST
jgi:exonuclease III